MLNANILLQGQPVNVLRALDEGNTVAARQGDQAYQTAQRMFLAENGAGIMSGDRNALRGLARFDPSQAQSIDLRNRADQRASAAAARSAQAAAQAQKLAAEQAQGREMFGKAILGLQSGDASGWNMLTAELGLAPGSLEPTEQNLGLVWGQLTQDPAQMLAAMQGPEEPAYRVVTGKEAQGMGLDPSRSYNVGADGKVTAIGAAPQPGFSVTTPDGMKVQYGQPGAPENPTPETDKPKKDYERVPVIDPDTGAVTGYEDRIIKGSETWNTRVDQSQKTGRALAAFVDKNGIVVDDIDRAISILETSDIPATGLANTLTGGIPGTPAYELNSLLQTVTGNVAFDYLSEMRQNSPTGGAVGQLSDSEREAMGSIQGSIKGANSKSTLLYNLNRLRDARLTAEQRLQQAYQQDFKDVVQSSSFGGQIPPAPEGIDPQNWPTIWDNMSEQDKRLFQ